MKRAVTLIQSCYRTRKVRRAALLKRARKHEGQMVKLQALFRAHLVRVRHAAAIKRIKAEAPKKTRKYQLVAKIQAHVRGFLFRRKRERALQKL